MNRCGRVDLRRIVSQPTDGLGPVSISARCCGAGSARRHSASELAGAPGNQARLAT